MKKIYTIALLMGFFSLLPLFSVYAAPGNPDGFSLFGSEEPPPSYDEAMQDPEQLPPSYERAIHPKDSLLRHMEIGAIYRYHPNTGLTQVPYKNVKSGNMYVQLDGTPEHPVFWHSVPFEGGRWRSHPGINGSNFFPTISELYKSIYTDAANYIPGWTDVLIRARQPSQTTQNSPLRGIKNLFNRPPRPRAQTQQLRWRDRFHRGT